MINIEKLNQFYGESHTLWDLDIEVFSGDCLAIMGRNGVGKTTLVESIMGLIPVESGRIYFEGNDLLSLSAENRASVGIGYVPQGRRIFPLLTVEENLKIGLAAKKTKTKKIPKFIFELFPILDTMLNRKGGDLSGGQQQQLAFGRALVVDPKLLILDEPTNDLDIVTLNVLESFLLDFPGCVIVVSHDRYFMDKVVDHLLVFKGEGEVEDLSLIHI